MDAPHRLRYVALGDSYTIGTGVAEPERWPNQLVEAIDDSLVGLELVANLAVNGYTTRDLIEQELPAVLRLRPEFISILIGVNDVVQGVPEPTFRLNVEHVLDAGIGMVGAASLVVVTIPDYTVTPAGAEYGDPAERSATIRRYNTVLEQLTLERAILCADIHPISLRAASDRSLVASDGLHPSGAQYALWVDRMRTEVEDLLAP